MSVAQFFGLLTGLFFVFGIGFGAGRNFSNESAKVMLIPLAFAICAAVADIAVTQADDRRAVATEAAKEHAKATAAASAPE
jgi:uncharacterized membrane protein YadS